MSLLQIWRAMPLSERIGALLFGPAALALAIGLTLIIGE